MNTDEHRAYNRERYKARRDAAIAQLGGKCVVCGTEEDLELDHIDPNTKRINFSTDWGVPESEWQKELAKTQLLCSIHHKKKSNKERSVGHGEGKTGKRNCYCELCKPLKQAYMRQYSKPV